MFRRLCDVMERSALADDVRFKTSAARNENADEIDGIVADWAAGLPLTHLEERLAAAQVPATRIFNMADIFADPHYGARDMLVPVPDDDLDAITMAAPVPHLSESPGRAKHAGHRVGQDTRTVLRDLGGLSENAIESLIAAGIVRAEDEP